MSDMPKQATISSVEVGDIKVTYLPDGWGAFVPTALCPDSDAATWQQRYSHLLDEEGRFLTTLGGYVIETGDRVVIVDTGFGAQTLEFPGFGPMTGGSYLESLEATGVDRDEVTDVLFTHLHLDHCGWTTVEENGSRQLTFPNARHRVRKAEWDFWYGGDEGAGPHPEYVQKPLEDRIDWFEAGEEVAPGVRILDTAGHTPGHVSILVSDGGERLVLTADVFNGAMQITETNWGVAFDNDPNQAQVARDGLFSELMQPDTIVGANHFSNQVFGRIVEEGGERRWEPLDV